MESSNINIQMIRRLLKYLLQIKGVFVLLILFCITAPLVNFISLLFPLFWGKLIAALVQTDSSRFLKILTYFIIFAVLKELFHFAAGYAYSNISSKIEYNIKKDMYKKYLNLPIRAYDKLTVGELSNRINDCEAILSIIDRSIYTITETLKAVGILIVIFYLNIQLSVILLISVVVSFLLFKKFGAILRNKEKEIAVKTDYVSSIIFQGLYGIREIKSLGIKENNKTYFEANMSKLKDKQVKRNLIRVLFERVEGVIQIISESLVIIIGGYMVLNGKLLLEYFIAFQGYYLQIFSTIESLSIINSDLQKVSVALERTFEIIDNKKYKDEVFGQRLIEQVEGKIEFKDVCFAYEHKYVLENISFKIESNTKTVIVGESGSGKTTIFNLILQLYNLSRGQILIDGIDINEFNEESLRKHISIIRQEPFLFNVSIKDNLLMVKENASQEELENACKMAYIHDYILSLPKKYDTIIGENGASLSVGQKQRLAIARALLKKSKIILFDEATSALDNQSQGSILKVINDISRSHTIIMIAHRMSTISNCQNVIVLNRGKISGMGTHEDLIAKNDIYKKLYTSENSR